MSKMVIGFVTLGLEFNGDTIKHKGLGGSETAVICMAREFAKLGHRVAVFCSCDAPGTYDGVDYYGVNDFQKVNSVTRWDVLVASRWPEFLTMPIMAGLRVLWLHDLIQDQARLMTQIWQTDLAILLSDYHIANYTEEPDGNPEQSKVPWMKKIIWKSSNGIDIEMIDAIRERTPKVPGKVIFTSRPERGLHYLTTMIFPELLKEFPALKLHYCNYSLGNMQVPDSVTQAHAICEQQAKKYPQNIINAGHLTKERLYEEMCSAELLLYPTNFGEISCITAMEAQACGTPIISTDAFALSETVENGVGGWLISGLPGDDGYAAKFTRKTLMMLRDKPLREKMGAAGVQFVKERGYTWAAVAKSWETKFNGHMEARFQENREAVVKELVHNGDLSLARAVLDPLDHASWLDDKIVEASGGGRARTNAKEVIADFHKSLPRFKDTLQFMAAMGVKPNVLWDYACGFTPFGLTYAQATNDTLVYCLDEDSQALKSAALTAAGDKLQLESRVRTVQATGFPTHLPKPNAIFLGNYLDSVEEPWHVLEKAAAAIEPGGHLIFTTRFGPDGEAKLWNFEQQDFYEMFGHGFKGHLVFKERGITARGEMFGEWIVILPIGEETPKVSPLLADRRRRTTRPYKSLAVCMIARDEEDWITMCLKRVYKIADKIVIALDTRTTDQTRELIQSLDTDGKVEIRDLEFEDFAQARNVSIWGVKEDWILWLDADERCTDPMKIPRYLHSEIHEGFSLKQCHLMLDVHGTYDVPVRLLRNREKYRFVGCIHEHCEDVSEELLAKNGYDNPIKPSIILPDCSLAHYGYVDEKQRRAKCSNRNMKLLQKDIEVYGKKGRAMSYVLAIRDYNNVAKWSINPGPNGARQIPRGSKEHALLEASVKTFLEKFKSPADRFYTQAFPMYQEALALLGQSGLPFENRKTPPFSVALALSGALGKDAETNVQPQGRWFVDTVEYSEFVGKQHSDLLTDLGIATALKLPESQVEFTYSDNLHELLSIGVDAIDENTGMFSK